MTAFVSTPPLLSRRPVADPRHRQSPAVAPTLSPCRMRAPSQPPPPISRRALLCGATATALASLILPADAKVDIDIERFGDKELKVSTINKVKQNVRNVLTQKPELLPYFFTLTLHDALTFNPVTLDGGPNGSLRLELERPENAALKVAADEIAAIRTLQRQDMSFADTCAFAGAVAVEVTGGPRIVVQLGREDAPDPDVVSGDGSALYTGDATAAQLRQAFEHAGLDGSRDVVLFHGAVGSLNDIGQTRAAKLRESAISDDDDEEEDDDVTSKDDVTYGKVQASGEPGGSRKRRGAVLVETNVSLLTLGGQKKFGNDYLKAMLKAAKDESSSSSSDSKLSKRDRELLNDKEMREMVQRYADNNGRFVNDMADLYQKVSLLGSSFESMTLRD